MCTFKRGKEKISILMPCSYGGVAQLGEHLPCKQGVRSSILLISTILIFDQEICSLKTI